jgi:hypothetical protein
MSTAEVIIHARFAPNGTIVEIGERPAGLTPQEWFDFLATKVGETTYQALSGGRGIYRLTREQVEALKAEATPTAA